MKFKDLRPFKKIIGDKRIVMLGEKNHGDGSTLLFFSRLIEFLHDQMDFNVIIFECGYFDAMKLNESLYNSNSLINRIQGVIPSVWSNTSQMSRLYNYIDSTRRTVSPLRIEGFDVQEIRYAKDISATIVKFLKRKFEGDRNILHSFELGYFKMIMDSLAISGTWLPPQISHKDHFFSVLRMIETRLDSIIQINPDDLITGNVKQLVINIRNDANLLWNYNAGELLIDGDSLVQLRDLYMAENAEWLLDHKYRNSKVIFFANSGHLIHNLNDISGADYYPYKNNNMGEILYQKYRDDIYTIGCLCYEGKLYSIGDGKYVNVPLPDNNFFEYKLNEGCKRDFCFVNMQSPSFREEFHDPVEFRLGGLKSMRAPIYRVLDGVIFIKQMEPNLSYRK